MLYLWLNGLGLVSMYYNEGFSCITGDSAGNLYATRPYAVYRISPSGNIAMDAVYVQ